MGHGQFVVQYSNSVDLYMTVYNPQFSQCQWGSIDNPNVLVWDTLAEAQSIASGINSGTVGTTRPS